jgi:Transposase DDE domain
LCSFAAYLHAPELRDAVRLQPTAFRRHRKLPFAQVLSTLLSGLTASVQNELNVFAAHLDNRAELWREVSAQAFSKARNGFSHQVFALLNQHLLGAVEEHLPVPRWRGFRLVAADASKLQLFLKDATGRKVREAIAFLLYLPGPELSLSFELYPPCVGERQMLFEHLRYLRVDDLMLLDRGYPARWVIAALHQRQRHFCMRVDDTGFAAVTAFRRSGQREAVIQIAPPSKQDARDFGVARKPTTVRLIRVVTPNGKVQVVMTSLLDSSTYPAADFADLYPARWRIEEAFKRIKHRLKLEHLSGLSWLAAQQDFGAKLVSDNLNALAIYAAQRPENTDPPDADVHYKPNRTYGFALLKRWLPRWLMHRLPDINTLLAVFDELLAHVIRFVPGKSKPRPKHPKPHLHHAYKSTA